MNSLTLLCLLPFVFTSFAKKEEARTAWGTGRIFGAITNLFFGGSGQQSLYEDYGQSSQQTQQLIYIQSSDPTTTNNNGKHRCILYLIFLGLLFSFLKSNYCG